MNALSQSFRQSAYRVLPVLALASSLAGSPAVFAAESHQHQPAATPVGWQQQLKGQTIVEDAIEGRAERSEKIEMQHHRLMRKLEEQVQQDAQAQMTSGAYNEIGRAHV